MTEEIKDLLSRIYDYMDEKSDSIDGPAGEPRPNIEMQFAGEIDKILKAPPSKSFSKEQVLELLRQQRKNCVNAFLENGRNASSAGLILNAPAPALQQPDPENYTIRDAHDQLDFDGASYQDAIQSPQPIDWEKLEEKFYKECVDCVEIWKVGRPAPEQMAKMNNPGQVWNWFKSNINK